MTTKQYERLQVDMLRASDPGTLPNLAALMFDLEPDVERLTVRDVEPGHLEVATPGFRVPDASQAKANAAMPAGVLVTFTGAIW